MSFQSWFATAGVTSCAAQPSRNLSFSDAISEWIFLPIALRRSSASAGEKPASCLAISRYCSWYTQIPCVTPVIPSRRGSMKVTASWPALRRA